MRASRHHVAAVVTGCVSVLLAACGADDGTRAVDFTHATYSTPVEVAAASEYMLIGAVTSTPITTQIDREVGLAYAVSDVTIERVVAQRPDVRRQPSAGDVVTVGVSVLDTDEANGIANFDELAEEFPTESEALPESSTVAIFAVDSVLGAEGNGLAAVGYAVLADGTLQWAGLPGPLSGARTQLADAESAASGEFRKSAPWRDNENDSVPEVGNETEGGRPPAEESSD